VSSNSANVENDYTKQLLISIRTQLVNGLGLGTQILYAQGYATLSSVRFNNLHTYPISYVKSIDSESIESFTLKVK
jgi:hypothetical protein